MPSFKPRNSKTISVSEKSSTTLDSKHNSLIKKIIYDEDINLPRLVNEKIYIKNILKSEKHISKKQDFKELLKSLRLKISKIKKAKKEYYLNYSKILFQYYENKNRIAEGGGNKKSLDTFFKKDNNNYSLIYKQTDAQKYLANVDQDFINIEMPNTMTNICKYCKVGELVAIEHEGILVCKNCSISQQFLIENEKPSYKEPPKEVAFYAYKRINHFREILAQFQAKETTLIPDHIIESIKKQIKKERITIEQLTNKRAKEILKKLGFNKYYEHIPFIKNKLGIKPPIMTPELEETLCSLFMEIQTPYAKYCPQDRVNFLNYYYTIYKLCELLNETSFLPYFPMLKDREKRIEQDEIWKKICIDLNWHFTPTI